MKKHTLFISTLLVLAMMLALLAGCSSQSSQPAADEPADAAATSDASAQPADADAFASWEEDSPTVALVKDYVAAVTDESSPDFIPVEDRIATIDFDGTLYAELDPIYIEWAMYIHRVLWDSTYTPTAEQVDVAKALEEAERTRVIPADLEEREAIAGSEVFKGMSIDDYCAYVTEFVATDAPKFTGLKRKDAFYQPMKELVKYLEANDFTCFIVSGTDRNVLRVLLAEDYPEIPYDRLKGTVSSIVASGQGDTDGLDYTWAKDDELVYGGELKAKNVKANKTTIIATEIGKQPVISLGNSMGDSSMANYVVNNNPYKSLALMVLCDDTERDWGEPEVVEKFQAACDENGWHAISKRDEWKTIYGEGVEKDTSWTWSSEVAGPNQADVENTPADEAEEELPAAA